MRKADGSTLFTTYAAASRWRIIPAACVLFSVLIAQDPATADDADSAVISPFADRTLSTPSTPVRRANTTAPPNTALDRSIETNLLDQHTRDSPKFWEILHPDQAFMAIPEIVSPRRLRVRFEVAPEYYLYRDKLKFEPSIAGNAILIEEVRLPRGEIKQDEYFGRVEIYRGTLIATLDLSTPVEEEPRSGPESQVRLAIAFQGCADAGLCYPPITKRFKLSRVNPDQLGAFLLESEPSNHDKQSSGGADLETGVDGLLSQQDRIARILWESNLWIVIGTFYVFGLLLSFTPCVLPMVPILSSILVSQTGKSRGREFALSSAYVGAMAVAQAIIGMIAGFSGANMQIVFQHPAVLIGFAAVFVCLGCAMFGFYELQLPNAWQSRLAIISARQRGGSYVGAAIMGLLSALIVGPCGAAPLAGALIYISQTGNGMLGGTALLALGLGMGTPLLVLGTSAKALLPRIGPWMEPVQRAFGFLLLGVAVYLLERILPGWLTLGLWSLLIICAAMQTGALEALGSAPAPFERARKSLGVVLLAYGSLVMVGAVSGGSDVIRPLAHFFSTDGNSRLDFRDVKGVAGLDAALATAKKQGQTVMLDYYADWCVSCKELEAHTFSDATVRNVLSDTLVLRTDVTQNDIEDRALLRRFALFGPPAILFFGTNGEERAAFRVIGYLDAKTFSRHAAQAIGQTEFADRQ